MQEQDQPAPSGAILDEIICTEAKPSAATASALHEEESVTGSQSQSEGAQEQGSPGDRAPTTAGGNDSGKERSGSQGGWGWAGWLPSSAVLQQAAAGALRDVQELKESLQQALAAEETDDEEGSKDRDKEAECQPGASPEDDIAKRRQAVLEQLEGQDHPLAAGFKALDDQIGVLADGVAGIAHNFWSTARITTAQIAGQVETGLEQLGHSAIQLLDGSLEQEALKNRGGTANSEAAPLTFDFAFHACGGRESCEELVEVTNECARSCKKHRAEVAPDARSHIDSILTELCPIFDLKGAGVQAGTMQSNEADSASGLNAKAAIDTFLNKGLARAQKVSPSGLRVPGRMAAAETEAVRLTARLAALCVQQLLLMARFLLGRVEADAAAQEGFQWPETPTGKAALLRSEALHMLAALQALATAYVDAFQRCNAHHTTQRRLDADNSTIAEGTDTGAGECKDSADEGRLGAPSSSAEQQQDSDAQPEISQNEERQQASSTEASIVQQPKAKDSVLVVAGPDVSEAVDAVKTSSAAALHVVVDSFKGLLYAVLLSAQELQTA